MRLKLLDRYIIKKFLGTFFFTIALIISLSIIFDIQEKLDDFIEKKAPLKSIIFDYYVNFAPYYVNLFMFLFIFISVILFTSKMASRCEVIAILSSGVSFRRMLFPYFVSAFFLAVLSFVLSSFIIPSSNKVRLDFENKYVNGTYHNKERNIHRQIQPGVFIYMESYNSTNDLGYKFSIEKFENKKLVSKLLSEYIQWDSAKSKWKINRYYIREISKDGKEKLQKGETIDTTLNIAPEDFEMRNTAVETMNFNELNHFINEQSMHGAETVQFALLEKYKRIAFPFSSFILTLIGVAVSSRKVRGGTGMHLGLGLLLSFSYILFMQIASQFALNSTTSPLLAVWIPNIIFSIIAVILYYTTPK